MKDFNKFYLSIYSFFLTISLFLFLFDYSGLFYRSGEFKYIYLVFSGLFIFKIIFILIYNFFSKKDKFNKFFLISTFIIWIIFSTILIILINLSGDDEWIYSIIFSFISFLLMNFMNWSIRQLYLNFFIKNKKILKKENQNKINKSLIISTILFLLLPFGLSLLLSDIVFGLFYLFVVVPIITIFFVINISAFFYKIFFKNNNSSMLIKILKFLSIFIILIGFFWWFVVFMLGVLY